VANASKCHTLVFSNFDLLIFDHLDFDQLDFDQTKNHDEMPWRSN